MKNNTIIRTLYGIIAMSLFALSLPANAISQEEVGEQLIDRSNKIVAELSALKTNNALSDMAALEVIQEHMSPLLNFEEFTKRAMGKHWRRVDDDVKKDITAAFRQLLENTYAKVLSQYSGQEVVIKETSVKEDTISVVLKIQGDGKATDIEYIFSNKKSDTYRVTDIKIEGISLVANYRRQFASFIQKNGAPALAEQLNRMAEAKIK